MTEANNEDNDCVNRRFNNYISESGYGFGILITIICLIFVVVNSLPIPHSPPLPQIVRLTLSHQKGVLQGLNPPLFQKVRENCLCAGVRETM